MSSQIRLFRPRRDALKTKRLGIVKHVESDWKRFSRSACKMTMQFILSLDSQTRFFKLIKIPINSLIHSNRARFCYNWNKLISFCREKLIFIELGQNVKWRNKKLLKPFSQSRCLVIALFSYVRVHRGRTSRNLSSRLHVWRLHKFMFNKWLFITLQLASTWLQFYVYLQTITGPMNPLVTQSLDAYLNRWSFLIFTIWPPPIESNLNSFTCFAFARTSIRRQIF